MGKGKKNTSKSSHLSRTGQSKSQILGMQQNDEWMMW
jgi:hypothetical protein